MIRHTVLQCRLRLLRRHTGYLLDKHIGRLWDMHTDHLLGRRTGRYWDRHIARWKRTHRHRLQSGPVAPLSSMAACRKRVGYKSWTLLVLSTILILMPRLRLS